MQTNYILFNMFKSDQEIIGAYHWASWSSWSYNLTGKENKDTLSVIFNLYPHYLS